jgi:hypothetical protein
MAGQLPVLGFLMEGKVERLLPVPQIQRADLRLRLSHRKIITARSWVPVSRFQAPNELGPVILHALTICGLPDAALHSPRSIEFRVS